MSRGEKGGFDAYSVFVEGGQSLILPGSSSSALHPITQAALTKIEQRKISSPSSLRSGTSAATPAAMQPTTAHTARNVRLNTSQVYRRAT
jgi:hypothetical protein